MLGSLFNIVVGLQAPAQVFPAKFAKIFKDTFFEKHVRTAASRSRMPG